MTWTTQKPTLPGWYWHRGTDGTNNPQVVHVWRSGVNWLCAHAGSVLTYTIPHPDDRGYHGEWAGPIPMPEEEKA